MDNYNSIIEKSLLSDDLKKITQDISESIIDSISEDGLLNEIPLISTSIGFYKAGQSFRLRNYIKNLYTFLFQLKDIDNQAKEKFIKQINDNENSKNELFERILFIIEKLDDSYKSKIIGKLFKSYIYDKINLNDFLRLSLIIERSFYKDLKYFAYDNSLRHIEDKETRSTFFSEMNRSDAFESLTNLGLLTVQISENIHEQKNYRASKKFNRKYVLTSIGRVLLENGFNKE